MISLTLSDNQNLPVTLPSSGIDADGKPAPLEGPAKATLATGAEFVSVDLDPRDPSNMTLLFKSLVTEATEGNGPWPFSGAFQLDARQGTETKLISVDFVGEVVTGDAVSFVPIVGQPEEQGTQTPPQRTPGGVRTPGVPPPIKRK